jgi:hypothetical protein
MLSGANKCAGFWRTGGITNSYTSNGFDLERALQNMTDCAWSDDGGVYGRRDEQSKVWKVIVLPEL